MIFINCCYSVFVSAFAFFLVHLGSSGGLLSSPWLVPLQWPAVAARPSRTSGSFSSEDRMCAHSDALCPELISCFVAEANLLNHSVQSDGGSLEAQAEDTGEKDALCGHKREALRYTSRRERIKTCSEFIVLAVPFQKHIINGFYYNRLLED